MLNSLLPAKFRSLQLAAPVVSLALLLGVPLARAETINVTLALFSDIYELDEAGGRGGFARIAGAVAAERAASPNTIVVHAGDTLSPSLMSSFDKGRAIMALLNAIKPEVFVPGNHEFDFGEAVFLERMGEAQFARLAANLRTAAGAKVAGFDDTLVIDRGGVKVGFIGLTDQDSAVRSSPGTLAFLPLGKTGEAQAKALRQAGVDLVVAVTHSPWQDDLRLAASGTYDVVLSGHDHSLLVSFDGRTVLAESRDDGKTLVAIDLTFDVSSADGKRKVTWQPRFRVVDTADVAPDAGVAALVKGFKDGLAKDLDVAIGTATVALDSRKASVRSGEAAIGNLIADAMRAATSADVAIMNGGGIRGDRTYDAGAKITRGDIFKELPFGNKLVLLELSGADLRKALENGVFFAGKAEGRFGQISGIKLTAKANGTPGSRIGSVMVGSVPLDDAKVYKVATNDFLASGKDGYVSLANGKVLIGPMEGPLLVTVVIDAIASAGTIAPAIDGRIVID